MEPMIRVGSRQAMYRLICLYQFVPLPLLKALLFAGSTAQSLEQNTWLSLQQVDISRFLLLVGGRFWCTHQLLVYGLPNYRTSWYPPAHACTNYRAGHFLSIPSIFPAPHTSCCDQLHTVPLDCYAWNKMLFYKVTMLLLGCLLIFAPDTMTIWPGSS